MIFDLSEQRPPLRRPGTRGSRAGSSSWPTPILRGLANGQARDRRQTASSRWSATTSRNRCRPGSGRRTAATWTCSTWPRASSGSASCRSAGLQAGEYIPEKDITWLDGLGRLPHARRRPVRDRLARRRPHAGPRRRRARHRAEDRGEDRGRLRPAGCCATLWPLAPDPASSWRSSWPDCTDRCPRRWRSRWSLRCPRPPRAQKPPSMAQFISPGYPASLVSAKKADRLAWVGARRRQAQRLHRRGARLQTGAPDVVPRGQRRGHLGSRRFPTTASW